MRLLSCTVSTWKPNGVSWSPDERGPGQKLDEMVAGPRAEDITAARAPVESLQAQVELPRLQIASHQRLLDQNATSRNEYAQYTFGLSLPTTA